MVVGRKEVDALTQAAQCFGLHQRKEGKVLHGTVKVIYPSNYPGPTYITFVSSVKSREIRLKTMSDIRILEHLSALCLRRRS